MLIGSGLLAQAFFSVYSQRDDVCIYAAGVSNSACTDTHEFSRERERLSDALQLAKQVECFVYFGTCSVGDPEALARCEAAEIDHLHPLGLGIDQQRADRERDAIGNSARLVVFA